MKESTKAQLVIVGTIAVIVFSIFGYGFITEYQALKKEVPILRKQLGETEDLLIGLIEAVQTGEHRRFANRYGKPSGMLFLGSNIGSYGKFDVYSHLLDDSVFTIRTGTHVSIYYNWTGGVEGWETSYSNIFNSTTRNLWEELESTQLDTPRITLSP